MNKKDTIAILAIGIAVGLLIIPVVRTTVPDAVPAVYFGLFLVMAVGAPVGLFLASLLARFWRATYQLGKFAAVGVLNSFVDLGVLNALIFLTGQSAGWLYGLFKTVSFLAAVTNSYFWNKHWTFESKSRSTVAETIRFYLVSLGGWAVNVGLAMLIVNIIPRPDVISPNLWANIGAFVAILGSMTVNFLGYKLFVFNKGVVANPSAS